MPAQKAIRFAAAFGVIGLSATVAYGQLGVISSALIKPEAPKIAAAQSIAPKVQNAISDGTVSVVKPLLDASEHITVTRVELSQTPSDPLVLSVKTVAKIIVTPPTLGFAGISGAGTASLPFVSVPDATSAAAPAKLAFTNENGDGFGGNVSEESAFEVEPLLKPRPLRVRPQNSIRNATRKVTRRSLSTVWVSGAYR